MTDLFRIGVKLYCTKGAEIDLDVLIPVFHRWIQQKRGPHMLIDVADYSHVPSGPGILLVATRATTRSTIIGGRRGLTFYRKRQLDGPLDERLLAVARDVVAAANALAAEPELAGRLEFIGRRADGVLQRSLECAEHRRVLRGAEAPSSAGLFDRALGAGAKLTRPTTRASG